MTVDEIIDVASAAYPDGLVRLYHDDPSTNHGDSIAKFIANEIKEAHRVREGAAAAVQLDTAIRYLRRAREDLEAVEHALRDRRAQLAG